MRRQEFSMPPTITLEQATGFGVFMIKAVLSRPGNEIVDLARVNLFRWARTAISSSDSAIVVN
jgi:pyruvate dehydrogenase (quinone)